ncbi:MAG: 3-oxoacid CoA-transferase [Euryarchaeota archaeon]|nr:3-oxoacid CoA-transferase [Euryarchaeota archaeon]
MGKKAVGSGQGAGCGVRGAGRKATGLRALHPAPRTLPAREYSGTELLICLVARIMENRKMAFIGTGVPMLAAALAKKHHAPGLMAVFEFGGTDPALDCLPLNVGAQQTFQRAISAVSLAEVMEAAQRGFLEYGFVGAAQIDPFGNLNTTVIGEHSRPAVRLPGSGGGCDIGALCWRTVALVPDHNPRKFVERLDFMTTAGYLDGPGARERAGLPPGSGPYRVVSNLAVMDYDGATRRMRLHSLNPGVTVEQVRQNTGFELVVPENAGRNEPPTRDELRILRREVDPRRLYI